METKKEIGDQGDILNLSAASRAMNIEPDEDQIEKFDEYEAKANPLKYVALILTIACLSSTVYSFYTGHWIWGSLLVPITLFLAMLSVSLGKGSITKRIAYENGLIIPAIIIELNPITIIALADMRSSSEQEKVIWGCQKMTIKNLPNHKIELGEKIPCVSLFGMAVKGYRRHFEPRPISWGYKKEEYVSKTVDFITTDNEDLLFESEWAILEKLADEMKELKEEKEVVFFDATLNRIEL